MKRAGSIGIAAALLLAGCGGCEEERERRPRRNDFLRVHEGRRDAGAGKVRPSTLPEATIGTVDADVRLDRTGRVLRRGDEETAEAPESAAALGDELRIGDAVVVGATGSAEIRLPEQGTLAIGNESRTSVSPWGSNELLLLRGRAHVRLEAPGRGRRTLKIATPGAYVTVQGTEIVVGAADDGSVRVVAVRGPAGIRLASGAVELAEAKAMEIGPDGRAGAQVEGPPAADAVSSTDGWVAGKRELARRGRAATITKLVVAVRAEVDGTPAEFRKVGEMRDRNRELLRTMREEKRAARAEKGGPAKIPGAPPREDAQRQLTEAGEALVEQTDVARAAWSRVFGRFELARLLGGGADAGVAPGGLGDLAQKIESLREEAGRLLRRAPRRPRPELRGAPRPMGPAPDGRSRLTAPESEEEPSKAAGGGR